MHSKPILHLRLNYAHQNLSPSFRILAVTGGVGLIVASIIGIILSPCHNMWVGLSFGLNLLMGLLLGLTASNYLPEVALKYIIINHNQFKYKLVEFIPRRSFNWDLVEQVELSSSLMRVRLENENKPRFIPLQTVSYADFEQLQKCIIDLCQERDIDLI